MVAKYCDVELKLPQKMVTSSARNKNIYTKFANILASYIFRILQHLLLNFAVLLILEFSWLDRSLVCYANCALSLLNRHHVAMLLHRVLAVSELSREILLGHGQPGTQTPEKERWYEVRSRQDSNLQIINTVYARFFQQERTYDSYVAITLHIHNTLCI